MQKACTLTGISRATYYRKAKPVGPMHGPWLPRTPPPWTLSPAERQQVLAVLNAPGYADLAIPQVWARELDEGRYWCSMSTMYRIARAAGQSRERRRQATHPPRVRPELIATGPSQVWSQWRFLKSMMDYDLPHGWGDSYRQGSAGSVTGSGGDRGVDQDVLAGVGGRGG